MNSYLSYLALVTFADLILIPIVSPSILEIAALLIAELGVPPSVIKVLEWISRS